ELVELAEVLRATFRLLGSGLGPFPYNYVIHSAPAGEEDRRFYLWHLEILPRLTMLAGFEMGSRIFINTAAPEATAAFLRRLAPAAALECRSSSRRSARCRWRGGGSSWSSARGSAIPTPSRTPWSRRSRSGSTGCTSSAWGPSATKTSPRCS